MSTYKKNIKKYYAKYEVLQTFHDFPVMDD